MNSLTILLSRMRQNAIMRISPVPGRNAPWAVTIVLLLALPLSAQEKIPRVGEGQNPPKADDAIVIEGKKEVKAEPQPPKKEEVKKEPSKKEEPKKEASKKEAGAKPAGKTEEKFDYDSNHFGIDPAFKKAIIERFQWKVKFWTSFNYFNNGDLRTLNETTETDVERTDDKLRFALSGAELDMFIPINARLDFRVDLWKTGFWGHDQLSGRDNNNDPRDTYSGSNTVNFGLVNMNVHFFKNPTRDKKLDFTVGRQDFRIGGNVAEDFFQRDTIDGLVLRGAWKPFGRLDVMLFDWYSSGANNEDVYFVTYISHDNEKVHGFDGNVNTFRSGYVYTYPLIGDSELGGTHLEGRIFYYLAKYAAGNDGGSDLSNQGVSGNFADRDYAVMRGARISAGWRDYLKISATKAESFGIDRRKPANLIYNQDIDTNGKAYDVELIVQYDLANLIKFRVKPAFVGSFFHADGGRYYIDSKQYSHGFVSFKGDRMGGIIHALNYGNHPSAFTDDDGIDDFPFERRRRTGTDVTRAGIRVTLWEQLTIRADAWWMRDTNANDLLADQTDTVAQNATIGAAQPVYQAQTSALAAQRRFGADLGREVNLGIDWKIYKNWDFWFTVGWFDPGRYFATTGLVQHAPEGPARAFGVQMGTSFYF